MCLITRRTGLPWWIQFTSSFDNLLFGFFISPYFGIGLGALKFSFGIRQLVPFSVNLRKITGILVRLEMLIVLHQLYKFHFQHHL